MPKPKKMTKTQAIHWSYAVDAHRMLEYDLHSVIKKDKMLPPGWDEIWRDIDPVSYTHLTLPTILLV